MERLKKIIYYARLVHESSKELAEAVGYKEELQRLKELEFYVRQLAVEVEHFENNIRQHFRKETGLRAFEGVWQRLNVKPIDPPTRDGKDV